MEMRLHIQSSEGGDDAAEAFQKQVMPKASVISATGDAIAIFREVQCLTPRYAVCLFVEFLSRFSLNEFLYPQRPLRHQGLPNFYSTSRKDLRLQDPLLNSAPTLLAPS